jgi:hypothetical protein
MTINYRPPATPPGDPAEYDTAAALAANAARLADAVDDNRPDWLEIALIVGDLLDALVVARLDAETDWNAVLADIYARGGKPGPADVLAVLGIGAEMSLYDTAADLSATAGDVAADLAEGRSCPAHIARARRLLDTLADAIGDGSDFPPERAA